MMKKYLNIGAVVGTAITIERLVRLRKELSEEANGKDGWWAFGGLLGAHFGNLINVVLWPVTLAYEVYDLTREE